MKNLFRCKSFGKCKLGKFQKALALEKCFGFHWNERWKSVAILNQITVSIATKPRAVKIVVLPHGYNWKFAAWYLVQAAAGGSFVRNKSGPKIEPCGILVINDLIIICSNKICLVWKKGNILKIVWIVSWEALKSFPKTVFKEIFWLKIIVGRKGRNDSYEDSKIPFPKVQNITFKVFENHVATISDLFLEFSTTAYVAFSILKFLSRWLSQTFSFLLLTFSPTIAFYVPFIFFSSF